MLQQGANEVDQLGFQDPGVLALDDILPEVREALLVSLSRPAVASSNMLRVTKSVLVLTVSGI